MSGSEPPSERESLGYPIVQRILADEEFRSELSRLKLVVAGILCLLSSVAIVAIALSL